MKTAETYDDENNVWELKTSIVPYRISGGLAVLKIKRDDLFAKVYKKGLELNLVNLVYFYFDFLLNHIF